MAVKFRKKLFSRFDIAKAHISNQGTHFYNAIMKKVLGRYGVHHRLGTHYHLQTSGQVVVTNRGFKRIMEKTDSHNRRVWSEKLEDVPWAFHTTYKTPIGTTPFKLVYIKAFYLTFELELKSYYALKSSNLDLQFAGKNRFMQLHERNELRVEAYNNSRIYKERTKRHHDARLKDEKQFK
ncbi:uncharacterized protein LOC143563673 [Bidens hawaiensis]|uniref:uncharacterized protein LOC143563673 n=1 Tax=Bidens hawaiensis TaxID=980011 RepID=UPI004049B1E4